MVNLNILYHTCCVILVPKTWAHSWALKHLGHPFFKYSFETGAYCKEATRKPNAMCSASNEEKPDIELARYGLTPNIGSPRDSSGY